MNKTTWTIIIGVACLIIIPIIMKKVSWNKLLKMSESNNFAGYYKELDSLKCKLSFSAFDRENMRLSGYITEGKNAQVEEQFRFMEHMRLKRKQRAALGARGFYYYLEKGRVKKARDMMELVKANGSEQSYKDLEIQYSILLKKESKHIQDVQDKIDAIWDGKSEIPEDKKMMVGTFEYLIGLQYSYENDYKNMMKHFEPAMKLCKGTPYEADMLEIIKTKKA